MAMNKIGMNKLSINEMEINKVGDIILEKNKFRINEVSNEWMHWKSPCGK